LRYAETWAKLISTSYSKGKLKGLRMSNLSRLVNYCFRVCVNRKKNNQSSKKTEVLFLLKEFYCKRLKCKLED